MNRTSGLSTSQRLIKSLIALPLCLSAVIASQSSSQPLAQTPNYDIPIHGKGEFVSTNSGRVYFEKEGAGPPLFIIAGGPGSSHASFHPWFSTLAGQFTLIYIDNIGRGRSDRLRNPAGYTVQRDAEDIEAVRQHLGYEKIDLLGHSYGGMPAMAYSIKYGARLNHLVLSSTLHSGLAWQHNIDSVNHVAQNQYPEIWEELLKMRTRGVNSASAEYAQRYGDAEGDIYWYDLNQQKLMYRSGDPKDGFNTEVYNAMLGPDPEWSVGSSIRSFDARRRLGRLTVPTLVVVGRFDRVATPKIAFEIKDALPAKTSQLVVFEKSGHRPWVEESAAYFNAISSFLLQRRP